MNGIAKRTRLVEVGVLWHTGAVTIGAANGFPSPWRRGWTGCTLKPDVKYRPPTTSWKWNANLTLRQL